MNTQGGLDLFFNVLIACSRLRDGGEQRRSGREKDMMELGRRAGGARIPRFFSRAFRISPFSDFRGVGVGADSFF